MDGIKYFQRLFKYDDWANRQVLSLLPTAPPRSLELLAHIFLRGKTVVGALHQRTQSFPVWPNLSLEQCAQQAEEVPAFVAGILQQPARP